MSMTGLAVFDRTLQKTNIWLNEISDDIGPDRQTAFHVLKAVLHTLRDRLLADEAADLAAQLPLLIRGVYFDGWRPSASPNRKRTRKDFIERISSQLQDTRPIDPEDACRAVFRTISRHIAAGELEQVKKALPKAVRDLWPDMEEDVQLKFTADEDESSSIALNEERETTMANYNRNDQWSRYDRDDDQDRYGERGRQYRSGGDYGRDWDEQGSSMGGSRGWRSDDYESDRYSRSGQDYDRGYSDQGSRGGYGRTYSGGGYGSGYTGGGYGAGYGGESYSQGGYSQGGYARGSQGGGNYDRGEDYSESYYPDQDMGYRSNDYESDRSYSSYGEGRGRRMTGNRQSYGYESNQSRRGRY